MGTDAAYDLEEMKRTILGGKITNLIFDEDEFIGEFCGFIVHNRGIRYQCVIMRDHEWNGPGHISIEPVEEKPFQAE